MQGPTVNRDTAICNLVGTLASLTALNQDKKVKFTLTKGVVSFTTVTTSKPEPVFTVAKRRFEDLKVGDITYFDYTDKTWHDQTRRGVVTEVGPDYVLIFDFQAVNHQTGQVGDYRISNKPGVSNVYVLTDYIPF